MSLRIAALALVATLAPVNTLMVATFALIMVDLVLGVTASIKRKKPITSAILRRTVVKILGFEAAIIAGHILEVFFLKGMPIVQVVSAAIALAEGTSIIENLKIIGLDIGGMAKFLKSDNDEDREK